MAVPVAVLHCSLSNGGGWSKMKVTFSVSSQSILKGLSRNFVTIIIYYLDYTRHQIKNDQPGSHDFWRFLRQF